MRIAFLSSRKPRPVSRRPPWLTATFTLATRAARSGFEVCTSVGNLPYEATLYAAARAHGRVRVMTDPNLLGRVQECLPLEFPAGRLLQVEARTGLVGPARDLAVIDAVDLAVAVAVRRGGHMHRLLLERFRNGKPVAALSGGAYTADSRGNRALLTAGVPLLATVAPDLAAGIPDLAAGIPDIAGPSSLLPRAPLSSKFVEWNESPLKGPTLTHYTRAAAGPWPGQPRWAYLEDLFLGGASARRDAAATLSRILEERRIRGSSRLIRGGYSVVSLTALRPEEVIRLHQYRTHLMRWDFEPYGVVFDREWVRACGGRPVAYLPGRAFHTLAPSDRPWYQKHEPPGCDYSAEAEWRVEGDLDFASAPREAIRVLRGNAGCAGEEHLGGVDSRGEGSSQVPG